MLVIVRKLLLTGILLLLPEDSSSQLVYALVITMASAVAYLKYQPFVDDAEDVLATLAEWSTWGIVYYVSEALRRGTACLCGALNPASLRAC